MDSDHPSSIAKSHPWSWKNSRFVLVVLLGFLILWSSYLVNSIPDGLPSRLGELALMQERSGDAAQQMIDRLHGKSVTPSENVIGTYSGTSGDAVLYLSVYAGREEAVMAERKMADRIREGNSVFGELEQISIADHPVAYCKGMGQVHYFFSADTKVYWLAIDVAAAPTAIAGLVAHAGTSGYSW